MIALHRLGHYLPRVVVLVQGNHAIGDDAGKDTVFQVLVGLQFLELLGAGLVAGSNVVGHRELQALQRARLANQALCFVTGRGLQETIDDGLSLVVVSVQY
ncbi:hypothetical protein D3C80_1316410 [compost metagenome]